jgi:hypothetical protein
LGKKNLTILTYGENLTCDPTEQKIGNFILYGAPPFAGYIQIPKKNDNLYALYILDTYVKDGKV